MLLSQLMLLLLLLLLSLVGGNEAVQPRKDTPGMSSAEVPIPTPVEEEEVTPVPAEIVVDDDDLSVPVLDSDVDDEIVDDSLFVVAVSVAVDAVVAIVELVEVGTAEGSLLSS